MKTKIDEILQLKLESPEDYETLNNYVRKIPFFRDREHITHELLEKFIDRVARKYPVMISSIMPCHLKNEVLWYSIPLKRTDTQECVKIISANTLYEALAKSAIYLYAYTRKYFRSET